MAEADRQLWTPAEPSAVAALTELVVELVVDLCAAWDYAVVHVGHWLCGWPLTPTTSPASISAWTCWPGGSAWRRGRSRIPSLPRAFAAAAAAVWARLRLDQAAGYGERAVAVAEADPRPMPL
jgi:hypothetical protein